MDVAIIDGRTGRPATAVSVVVRRTPGEGVARAKRCSPSAGFGAVAGLIFADSG